MVSLPGCQGCSKGGRPRATCGHSPNRRSASGGSSASPAGKEKRAQPQPPDHTMEPATAEDSACSCNPCGRWRSTEFITGISSSASVFVLLLSFTRRLIGGFLSHPAFNEFAGALAWPARIWWWLFFAAMLLRLGRWRDEATDLFSQPLRSRLSGLLIFWCHIIPLWRGVQLSLALDRANGFALDEFVDMLSQRLGTRCR